jgi:hypothetical protein
MTKVSLAICGIALMGIIGCTKEGPQGPPGNANVVSSTISSSAWAYSSPSWSITFTYPAITQDIIDKGAVLVYLKNGQAFAQLPLTIYQTSSYSTSIEVASFVGGVKIFWTDSDLIQPDNPGNREFKIVVIAASGLAKNPNLDLNDYNAVKQAYNLSESENIHYVK